MSSEKIVKVYIPEKWLKVIGYSLTKCMLEDPLTKALIKDMDVSAYEIDNVLKALEVKESESVFNEFD